MAPILAPLLPALLAGPATEASASVRHDGFERALIRAVNVKRAAGGLPKLRASRRLARPAERHSRDMLRRDFFAHDTPGGWSWHSRISSLSGRRDVGEVLAMGDGRLRGRRDVRRVVNGWMRSPGHRRVLMTRRFRKVGIARRVGRYRSSRATAITADLSR